MTDHTTDEDAWQHALNADPNAPRHAGTSPTRRPRPGRGNEADGAAHAPSTEADPWERALDGPPFAR